MELPYTEELRRLLHRYGDDPPVQFASNAIVIRIQAVRITMANCRYDGRAHNRF
jgi:hypothetical protein